MQYDSLMEDSLCYKMIRTLYCYLLTSVFFRIFIASARTIYNISRGIIYNSESRHLFISSCSACKGNTLYFILAFILSILIYHISASLLVFGKIGHIRMSLFCVTPFAIYFVRKSAIKYAASIYFNSYVFRLINRKI